MGPDRVLPARLPGGATGGRWLSGAGLLGSDFRPSLGQVARASEARAGHPETETLGRSDHGALMAPRRPLSSLRAPLPPLPLTPAVLLHGGSASSLPLPLPSPHPCLKSPGSAFPHPRPSPTPSLPHPSPPPSLLPHPSPSTPSPPPRGPRAVLKSPGSPSPPPAVLMASVREMLQLRFSSTSTCSTGAPTSLHAGPFAGHRLPMVTSYGKSRPVRASARSCPRSAVTGRVLCSREAGSLALLCSLCENLSFNWRGLRLFPPS